MKYIVGNWKMNMLSQQVISWVESFMQIRTVPPEKCRIIIGASFPHLPLLKITKPDYVALAGQDVSVFEMGAHTGEVGAFQLKDFCEYCIIGHSERKENKETVVQKRDRCLENNITPIICFIHLEDLKYYLNEKCIFAWEDPQNISKGGKYRSKPISDIEKGVREIRKDIKSNIKLIYGGSVNETNVLPISEIEGLDGILPGQASTSPVHFNTLVGAYENSLTKKA